MKAASQSHLNGSQAKGESSHVTLRKLANDRVCTISDKPIANSRDVIDEPSLSIISDQPVSQESRRFWDSIVADATALDSGRHVLEQRWINALFQQAQLIKPQEVTPPKAILSHVTSPSEVSSRTSISHAGSLDTDSEDSASDKENKDEEVVKVVVPKRRQTFFNFHQRTHHHRRQEGIASQQTCSGQTDMDGPADSWASEVNEYNRAVDSDTRPDELSDQPWRRKGSSDSVSTEIDLHVEVSMIASPSSSSASQQDDQSTPLLPVLPRCLDAARYLSRNLPRSRLYISQAAKSSSPEKQAYSLKADAGPCVEESSGIPSRHGRRHRRYIPRSQSYSFENSEPFDTRSTQEPNPTEGDRIQNFSESNFASPPSSHPEESRTRETQRPITPSRGSATGPPRLPPPFSTTPRNVSFDVGATSPTTPSTHSHSSPTHVALSPPFSSTPPNQHVSPARYVPSPSPPIPMTPYRSMRVYNDNLPRSSQPQTPVGLRRHGIPSMANPLFTAPQLGRPISLHGMRRERGNPRRGRGSEQENVGGEVAWLLGNRERTGRARRERYSFDAEETGLNRTPP